MSVTIQQTGKIHKFVQIMVIVCCIVGAVKLGGGDAGGLWWISWSIAVHLINKLLIWWNHK